MTRVVLLRRADLLLQLAPLAALCLVPGCRSESSVVSGGLDAGGGSRFDTRALTSEEQVEAEKLLERTAAFRKIEAHPRWEKWAARDLRLLSSEECESTILESWHSGPVRIPLRAATYVLRRDTHATLSFAYDEEDGSIRDYSNLYVRRAIEQELLAGENLDPELTREQAVARAKEYVASVVGAFPGDLRLDMVQYIRPQTDPRDIDWTSFEPSGRSVTPKQAIALIRRHQGPDLYDYAWSVRFYRYAGDMEYTSDELVIRFSERHGVERYFDKCYEPWDGKITVTADRAEAIAARADIQKHVWRSPEYPREKYRLTVLKPRVRGERPVIMHVVKDDPRKVRAVWAVGVPYAWTPVDGSEEPQEYDRIGVLVDAETGELRGCVD